MIPVSDSHFFSHQAGKMGGRQNLAATPPSTHTHTPLTETAEYN